MEQSKTFTAFLDGELIASGHVDQLLAGVKARFDQDPGAPIFIFEDDTGRPVDFDLRGTLTQVLARVMPARLRSGPGRPKLGVVAREVSLLPRHWEWLEKQPSGSSAAIRRLVEEARKRNPEEERRRLAIEATSRFMTAIAGNLPNYEEAMRALFRRNYDRLGELISDWPEDVRRHVEKLVRAV